VDVEKAKDLQKPGHARDSSRDYWGVMLGTFLASLGYGMVGPFMPVHAKLVGASTVLTGLVMSAFGLGRVLINVPAGRLGDRHGHRVAIVCGGLVWAVVGVLYSRVSTAGLLVPLAFAMGLGRGVQWTGLLAAAGSLSHAGNRGRIMSTLSTFDILGYCPGPVIGGILAGRMGAGAPFLALAALEATSALVAMALCKQVLRREPVQERQDTAQLGARTVVERSTGSGRLPRLFPLVAAAQFMIFFGAAGTFGTIMPLIGVSRCGLAPSQVGGALTAGLALMVISMQLAGRCFDAGYTWQALAGGTCVGVLAMVVLSQAHSATAFFGAVMIQVFASGFVYPVPPALAASMAGESSFGRVMGLSQTAGDAGNCTGPAVQSLVSELAGGNYAVPVLAHACVYSAVFTSLVVALRRSRAAGPSETRHDHIARDA